MYEENSMIVYGSYGVCRVAGIVEKKFGKTSSQYYLLEPVGKNTSTVYVPVNSEALIKKMHPLLSSEEVYQLVKSMPEEDAIWFENERERRTRYKEIVAGGDRVELIRLIKALYLHRKKLKDQGKRLHTTDERFFKEAEKILYEEFSYVLNIKEEQVLSFILEELG